MRGKAAPWLPNSAWFITNAPPRVSAPRVNSSRTPRISRLPLKRALASGRPACLNIVTDRDVIEPGTLAMYSAGLTGLTKEKPKPDPGGETTLPYYGKRKLD